MRNRIRVGALVACTSLCGCTTITSLAPDPAIAGQEIVVGVKGVIGPSAYEPGAELLFEGIELPLTIDTSDEIAATIPPGTPPGEYRLTVKDKIGLLEILLVFPLFKDREDTKDIFVDTLRRDLAIDNLEVTQAIQNKSHSVPLVTNKPTVIRVFPIVVDSGPAIPNVTAKLHGERGGVPLPNSPQFPFNDSIVVNSTFDRANPDASLNFQLPDDWINQDVDVWAEVSSQRQEANPIDNRMPIAGTRPVDFQDRVGMTVQYVHVRHENNQRPPGPTLPGDQVDANTIAPAWWQAIFPVDPALLKFEQLPEVVTGQEVTAGAYLDTDHLMNHLWQAFLDAGEVSDRLYGWTPRDSIYQNGRAHRTPNGGSGLVAAGNDNATPELKSRYRRTFAHELGHITGPIGLNHIDYWLALNDFGFDTMNVDPFERIVMRNYPESDPLPKNRLWDFMKGGEVEPHAWIRSETYTTLFDLFASATTLAPDPSASSLTGSPAATVPQLDAQIGSDPDLLLISGHIGEDGTGEFFTFWEVRATDLTRQLARGTPTGTDVVGDTHTIKFKNSDEVLLEIPWSPTFEADDSRRDPETVAFSFIVPKLANVTGVELFVHDAMVASVVVPTPPPILTNLSLAVGAEIDVSWTAVSPVRLKHRVQYSNDGGTTWRLVGTDLNNPELSFDTATLPGGGDDSRVRVSSSDGYQTRSLTSGAFTIANKPPKPTISAPRDGLQRAEGSGVLFIGQATDLEDGTLAESQLTWLRFGSEEVVGTGSKLFLDELETGSHKIVLRATDSRGLTTTSNPVEITVVPRANVPDPVLDPIE